MKQSAVIIVSLFVAVHWLIYVLMPDFVDDFTYKELLYPYFEEGKPLSWQMIADTYRLRLTYDNWRLSNMLYITLQLLPRPLVALLPASGLALLCYGCARFVKVRLSVSQWIVAMLLISVCLPWYEDFFSLNFAMNYVVGAGLAALWLTWLCSHMERHVWGKTALSLLLGLWHEGFAVPLLIGGIVYLTIVGAKRSKSNMAIVAGLLPGVIISAVSFMVIGPKSWSPEMTWPPAPGVLKFHVPLLLFIMLAVYVQWRKGLNLMRRAWVWALIATAIGAIAINSIIMWGERPATVAYVCAILGIMRLLPDLTPKRKIYSTLIGCIIAAWLVVHFAYVIRATVTLRDTVALMKQSVRATPHSPEEDIAVFVPLQSPNKQPWIYWRKPATAFLPMNTAFLSQYMRIGDATLRFVNPIPEVMRHGITPRMRPIPGTEGVYEADGWLVRPWRETDLREFNTPVRMQLGPFEKSVVTYNYPFTATDGRRYTFVYIESAFFPSFMFDIKRFGV